MSSNKLRIACGLLIAGALVSVVVFASRSNSKTAIGKKMLRLRNVTFGREGQKNARQQSIRELKKLFPKVDYDAPEPTDPAEKAKRRNKGKQYDKLGGVSREPTHYSSGLISHWEVNLPALPVEQSSVIVLGTTQTRGAFLSADKGAVYTEVSVKVEDVLTGANLVNNRSVIDLKRLGGVVRYRTGEESLFHIVGQNMPDVAKRYLFFLKALPESEDFEVVTAYELTPSGVAALDSPSQFTRYNGHDEAAFLDEVRIAIQKKQS